MKVLLGGAYGNLGREILEELLRANHEVIAIGRHIKNEIKAKNLTNKQIDVTDPKALKGICAGVETLITTIGLTTSSKTFTHYDIDLNGNLNLLKEAQQAGVKKIIYTSVIKCDTDPTIPMLDAKHRFEDELKQSGIEYTIYRPTGYFYDISKVFKPMVEKGSVMLLKGKQISANVIHTIDFAKCIVENINQNKNQTIEIGGREVYTYEEIARIFFTAAGKELKIKYVSPWVLDLLAWLAKVTKNGKYANIKFGKWTLTYDMTAQHYYGESSFKEYVQGLF